METYSWCLVIQAREEVKTLVKGLEADVLARLVGLEKDSGKTNGKVEVKAENGKEADVKPENGTTVSSVVLVVSKVLMGSVDTTSEAGKGKTSTREPPPSPTRHTADTSSQTPEQIAEKQAKEAEKQAKEAEKKAREQEKARKAEVKTKKAQEVAKSKAMMASFFGKPKAATVGSAGSVSSVGKEVEVQVARAKSRSESGMFVSLVR